MDHSLPRVLLVSGDYDFCDHATRLLTEHGFDAEGVNDSRSALEAFQNASFDIVVVDHWLPYVNAIPVVRQLRRQFQQPSLVVLTGNSAISPAEADFVLRKQDDGQELLATLERLAEDRFVAVA